ETLATPWSEGFAKYSEQFRVKGQSNYADSEITQFRARSPESIHSWAVRHGKLRLSQGRLL
ncbi:MAG TPA: hypothetical protein VMF06_24475, partial [Candidatus Limnocylindria bacterium]|nr:hypothetical protein [Candidatus Limnocylindria bacterium]